MARRARGDPCRALAVLFRALCVLALVASSRSNLHKVGEDAAAPQREFFQSLDVNHDGQISEAEATAYIRSGIGGTEFDTPAEIDAAVRQMVANVDGGDGGTSISSAELDRHLHSVLDGVRVADWVQHAVGLAQYAEAFRANAISPLDFPLLIQNGGALLAAELGVASALHRAKLVRAMQQQILGLGHPPTAPSGVACAPLSENCAIKVQRMYRTVFPHPQTVKSPKKQARVHGISRFDDLKVVEPVHDT